MPWAATRKRKGTWNFERKTRDVNTGFAVLAGGLPETQKAQKTQKT
jgi:hypothetical protein